MNSFRRLTMIARSRAVLGVILLLSLGAGPAAFSQTSSPAVKPTIVLVHGAFADGTGWQHVNPLLERDGYTVTAVQNPLTSVEDDIATTRRLIDAQPGPVVVVGHSYGGVVITGAASGNSKVKALVYIAAFAPDSAEPIGPLFEKYPSPSAAALRPDAAGFFYIDRAVFRETFCQDVGAEESAVMAATQKPLAGSSFAATLTVPPAWKSIPSWFIVARNDRVINPDLERFFAQRMRATTTELASSHVPFISRPAEVVTVIEQAATTQGTAAGISEKH
jgi:pimeloyl-ACP methyl ester carboxylesterase